MRIHDNQWMMFPACIYTDVGSPDSGCVVLTPRPVKRGRYTQGTWGPRTEDPGPGTEDQGPGTEDPGPRTRAEDHDNIMTQ